MKIYNLEDNLTNEFMYVYSPACKAFKTFNKEAGCICNDFNSEINDWDYVSIITKDKYKSGCTVKTKCSFKSFGAPLIVFSNDITKDENGYLRYGHHYEIVAYENGINVWCIDPDPSNTQRAVAVKKVDFIEFPVEAGSEFELEVKIEGNKITSKMLGFELVAEDDTVPEEFHVGITACEGKNYFYEFSAE